MICCGAVLKLNVLVEAALRSIALLTLIVSADVMSGDLAGCPSHPFFLFLRALDILGVVMLVGTLGPDSIHKFKLQLSVAFLCLLDLQLGDGLLATAD